MINESIFQMRQQYLAIKSQSPDALLLFRSGDYYEAFDADAKTVAAVNAVAITSAEVAPGVRVPAVGVPYHRIDDYVAALVQAGYTVAIAEQVAKAPRGATVERVVTQATLLDEVTE